MATHRDATTEIPAVPAGSWSNVAVQLAIVRDYGIVVSFVALFVTLSLLSDAFLSTTNLLNIMEQWAPVGLVAVGGTLLIISGGFDLSVGAIFSVAGIVAAQIAQDGHPVLALLAGAAAGIGLGIVNGFLVTVGRINPFVATIASAVMIRGLGLVLTGGFIVVVSDLAFTKLGRGSIGLVNYSVILFLGFALVLGFALYSTQFGRYIYASGGNPEAARLSGVRVGVVRTVCYAISGLSAGLAGLIVASRTGTGQVDLRSGIEFEAITAIVIGGTSIFGGEGAVWRTVLGVLLLAMIGNGFNLMNVDPTYQQILLGGIIVTAVAVDAWSRRTR